MKKLLVLFILLAFTATLTFGQGIFKPVPQSLFKTGGWAVNKEIKKAVFIPRLSAGVVANIWTVQDKKIVSSTFNKVGMGLSMAHYIEVEAKPYNNYSISAFAFFPTDGSTKLTFAATVSALQYINVGICYDLAVKKPGLLTGISYTF